MPTVFILVFTLIVISTVIPYAFSTAINQLRALEAREAAEATERNLIELREGETERTFITDQAV